MMALADRLDAVKNTFGPRAVRIKARQLEQLARARMRDVENLVRAHEFCCYLQAYPDSPQVLRRTEGVLAAFAGRRDLTRYRNDLENSGIAGTELACSFSYHAARSLCRRHGPSLGINWAVVDAVGAFPAVMARLVPYLKEEMVYPEPRYRGWVEAARGRRGAGDLIWLIERAEAVSKEDPAFAGLLAGLEIPIRWRLGDRPGSRTRAKLSVSRVYYQRGPLRERVDLLREVHRPGMRIRPAGPSGGRLLETARAAVSVRMRELDALNDADPDTVLIAEAGRGLQVVLIGARRERRLPLRALYAYLLLKNGVPVGYGDALLLFDAAEVAYNIFETFRQGESSWVYAQVLRMFRQHFGTRYILVHRYQIGDGNAEAIESGAFWFYFKLGFRPTDPARTRLADHEQRRVGARPAYRSSAVTLRRLAAGDLRLALVPGVERDFAGFDVMRMGLHVQRVPARHAEAAMGRLGIALGPRAPAVLREWARLLAALPDFERWSRAQTRGLQAIMRAKLGPDEATYIRRMSRHAHLRDAILRLGRSPAHP